jgi:hypothetical protein
VEHAPWFTFANVIIKQMKKIHLIKVKMMSWIKLGLTGIGLCGLCCALPFISAFLGMSSMMAIGYYLDKVAFILITIAVMVLIYTFYKKLIKRRASETAPDLKGDCSCGSHENN